MTETALLSARDVGKSFGRHIGCTGVSFDLYPGEVIGIVGESGSGKSTLLNCLAGHLVADRLMVMKSGRVVENGLTECVLDDPQHPYSQLLVSSVLQV